MNIPQDILEEINRHDLNTFKTLGLEHTAVTYAISFLLNNDMPEMGKSLRQLILNRKVCQGPLQGFVAAAVHLTEGEYLLLSTLYPEYGSHAEMMVSLVSEIGYLDVFNRSQVENELRGEKAMEWLSLQKPIHEQKSFISIAANKKSELSKESDLKDKT